MSQKTPQNTAQDIELNNAENSGQIGQASRDLVQIGRDYIQYIYNNSYSGNWRAVAIALIPLFLFLFGVKAGADKVVEVFGAKSSSELVKIPNPQQQSPAPSIAPKTPVPISPTDSNSTNNGKVEEAGKPELPVASKPSPSPNPVSPPAPVPAPFIAQQPPPSLVTPSQPERPSISSTAPPFGTASQSWCMGMRDQWKFRVENFGTNDESIGVSMRESGCGYWEITAP